MPLCCLCVQRPHRARALRHGCMHRMVRPTEPTHTPTTQHPFLHVQYASLGAQASQRVGPRAMDSTPQGIVNRLAGGPQIHGVPGLDVHLDPQFQEFNRIFNDQARSRAC